MIQKPWICFTYMLWLLHRWTNLFVVSQFLFSLPFFFLGWCAENNHNSHHLLNRPPADKAKFVKIQGNWMPIICVKFLFSWYKLNCISFFITETSFSSLRQTVHIAVSWFEQNVFCWQHSEACIELCKEMNLMVVDLWTAIPKSEDCLLLALLKFS